MRWSKLKQTIEGNFADSVKGRVEIWTTRYRHSHDQEGEAWITVDGKRLHSMGSIRFIIDEWNARGRPNYMSGERPIYSQAEVEAELHACGTMGLWSVNSALFGYLSMPIEAILASDIALVRALGVLDRRVGKRRLATLDVSGAPIFVHELHRLRCFCEGVRLPDSRPTASAAENP